MFKALLIGFVYSSGDKLLGSYIDLYMFYRYCLNKSSISIITDITHDAEPTVYKKSINNGEIDSKCISFIETIKKTDIYNRCDHQTTFQAFDKLIDSIIFNNTRLLIYFSGHGIANSMVLPSGESYPYSKILDKINRLDKNSEIIWINDCCNCNINIIPYKIRTNMLPNRVSTNHPKQKIININSTSNENENAVVSFEGSIFTRLFMKSINENLDVLLNKTSEILSNSKINQTPSIMVSYPNMIKLFPWFYGIYIYKHDHEIILLRW